MAKIARAASKNCKTYQIVGGDGPHQFMRDWAWGIFLEHGEKVWIKYKGVAQSEQLIGSKIIWSRVAFIFAGKVWRKPRMVVGWSFEIGWFEVWRDSSK